MAGLSDGSQQSVMEEDKNESKDESSKESTESKKDLRDYGELVTGLKSIGLPLPKLSGVRNISMLMDSTLEGIYAYL